jgi:hypothetical protein
MSIATIEAISEDPIGRRVVEAWVAHQVPQCGYCQSGQVMTATALLKQSPKPSEQEIAAAMINLSGAELTTPSPPPCGTLPKAERGAVMNNMSHNFFFSLKRWPRIGRSIFPAAVFLAPRSAHLYLASRCLIAASVLRVRLPRR